MMHNPRIALALVGISALIGVFTFIAHEQSSKLALLFQAGFTPAPDGTLMRADNDPRIFYVEEGRKRWIESYEAFTAQGFRFADVVMMSNAEIERYLDGEPITAYSPVVLPGEVGVLPDLSPRAPYEVRLSTRSGRSVLRFTGAFWNQGNQAFELRSDPAGGAESVYQHVIDANGGERTRYVGTFEYHPEHEHHHFADFAEYIILPIQAALDVKEGSFSARQKTTYCFRDDERMPAGVPNAPASPVYLTCGADRQGVSAGWVDVYRYSLADQYLDVHDLPSGIYALEFLLDPRQRFIEGRMDNNISMAVIELDVPRGIVRTVASFSPFPTTQNTFPDGMLVRTSWNSKVYLLENGAKRWIRSADIFTSYGLAWDAITPVTEAMARAIPTQFLIRRQGTSEVYVLNEDGYRHHLRSLAIMQSYGFFFEDVVVVNDLDFASYPAGDLIMRDGDTQVYRVVGTTRQPIGTLSALRGAGYDLRGLQVINATDFNEYVPVP